MFEKFAFGALSLVVLFFVSLGGYAIVKAVSAEGTITYCYTEYWSPSEMPPMVRLHGFRPWRPDRFIGNYKNLDDAVHDAELIGCKIEKQ